MAVSYEIPQLVKINEMFSFFRQECTEKFDFKGEQHNFWECLYVKNGAICVSADERVYKLRENQLIFHKPMEFHKFYVESTGGAEITVFSYTMEGELKEFFENKVFDLSAEQIGIVNRLSRYAESRGTFCDNFDDVAFNYTYMNSFEGSGIFAQTVTTYIHQLFLSLADSGTASEVYRTEESDTFKRAVNYMRRNVSLAITVGELADYCRVSPATLKRIFARYTGIGIHKYFLQMKLKCATELLQRGESVSSVSEKLGFSSQCYFSAAFKRETGKSPSRV